MEAPRKVAIPWGGPDGMRFLVVLTFEEIRGRPECIGVDVQEGGRRKRPIRATDLRSIPLGALIDQALTPSEEMRLELHVETDRAGRATGARFERTGIKRRRRDPDDPIRLARAAVVYEQGGRKPVEQVARTFTLSHSGAAKLVGRARREGYLTGTSKRVVGGRATAKARRVLKQHEEEGQP